MKTFLKYCDKMFYIETNTKLFCGKISNLKSKQN